MLAAELDTVNSIFLELKFFLCQERNRRNVKMSHKITKFEKF